MSKFEEFNQLIDTLNAPTSLTNPLTEEIKALLKKSYMLGYNHGLSDFERVDYEYTQAKEHEAVQAFDH